jgi:pSer/pThr/pTyr-binding forkhead associated (FHA) protein
MAHLASMKSPQGPGPRPGNVFPLTADRTVLGRQSDTTSDGAVMLLIPHHAVARQHAEIVRSGTEFRLRDLKSRSKTYVNGVAFGYDTEVLLADGDQIRICGFAFVFHTGEPEMGTPADGF